MIDLETTRNLEVNFYKGFAKDCIYYSLKIEKAETVEEIYKIREEANDYLWNGLILWSGYRPITPENSFPGLADFFEKLIEGDEDGN